MSDNPDKSAFSAMWEGDYELAESLWTAQLRKLYSDGKRDTNELASVHNSLGALYSLWCKNTKAEDNFHAALALTEQTDSEAANFRARVYFNLGSLLIHASKHRAARRYLTRALALHEHAGGALDAVLCKEALAQSYYYSHDHKTAERLLVDCLSIRQKLKLSHGVFGINDYKFLVKVYLESKQHAKAKEHLTDGYKWIQSNSYLDESMLYLEHGLVLLYEGKTKEAEAMMYRYLETTKDAVARSQAQEALAAISLKQGDTEGARQHAGAALVARVKCYGWVHPISAKSMSQYAECIEAEG